MNDVTYYSYDFYTDDEPKKSAVAVVEIISELCSAAALLLLTLTVA